MTSPGPSNRIDRSAHVITYPRHSPPDRNGLVGCPLTASVAPRPLQSGGRAKRQCAYSRLLVGDQQVVRRGGPVSVRDSHGRQGLARPTLGSRLPSAAAGSHLYARDKHPNTRGHAPLGTGPSRTLRASDRPACGGSATRDDSSSPLAWIRVARPGGPDGDRRRRSLRRRSRVDSNVARLLDGTIW